MAWDTVANIVNDAAVELALIPADITDPYASTDPLILQLLRLLKGLGQDLVRDFRWSHLQKSATVSTVNGTAAYNLATDYGRLVDGTEWDRTQQAPLGGPLNAQQWQMLKAQTTSGTVNFFLRIFNNQLNLFPTPTSVHTLAYEYLSTYWVQPSGQASPTTDAPTLYTDTLAFDRRLLVLGLKLAFLRAKGFDTSAAQDDFDRALSRAQGADGAAPVLSLTGARGGVRLIDGSNLPETGFGS